MKTLDTSVEKLGKLNTNILSSFWTKENTYMLLKGENRHLKQENMMQESLSPVHGHLPMTIIWNLVLDPWRTAGLFLDTSFRDRAVQFRIP